MPDTKDSLDEILTRASGKKPLPRTEPDSEPADESDAITIADMNGTHSMRPANKNLTRIHIVDRAGKVRSYQYAYLDSESTYDGGTFTLLFVGVKHWRVTVKGHGKKFWSVYDYISLHRWPFLREAAGSMPEANGDGQDAVFTSIEFKDVTPQAE